MQPGPTEKMVLYRIRFVAQAQSGETVLLELKDPYTCRAVLVAVGVETAIPKPSFPKPDELEILAIACKPMDLSENELGNVESWVKSASNGEKTLISLRVEEAQVLWSPGKAVFYAPSNRVSPMLTALTEFAFYEGELSKLEGEIAAGWPEAETDAPLAYEVTRHHLPRHKLLAERSFRVLQWRMRHVRVEPHLHGPAPQLSELGRKLGERLRRETGVEDRLEFLDGKIESCEYIYEMVSQRMGEYQNFHREFLLELLIVLLLGAEAIVLVVELFIIRR